LCVDVSSLKYVERLAVRIVIEIPEQDEPLVFVVAVKLLHECSRRTFTGRVCRGTTTTARFLVNNHHVERFRLAWNFHYAYQHVAPVPEEVLKCRTGKKEVCIVGIEVWAILELKWVSHDNSQVLIVVAVIVNQDRRGICFE
jgi:hypothetical protein